MRIPFRITKKSGLRKSCQNSPIKEDRIIPNLNTKYWGARYLNKYSYKEYTQTKTQPLTPSPKQQHFGKQDDMMLTQRKGKIEGSMIDLKSQNLLGGNQRPNQQAKEMQAFLGNQGVNQGSHAQDEYLDGKLAPQAPLLTKYQFKPNRIVNKQSKETVKLLKSLEAVKIASNPTMSTAINSTVQTDCTRIRYVDVVPQFQWNYNFVDQKNGLAKSERMIIIIWLKYHLLQELSISHQVEMKIKASHDQIEFRSLDKNQRNWIQFCSAANQLLDQIAILTHVCQDAVEMHFKILIIGKEKDSLQNLFGPNFDGKIYYPQNIDISSLQNTVELKQIFNEAQLLQDKFFFFILVEKTSSEQISEYQNMFDTCILQFVRSECRLVTYSFDHQIFLDKKEEDLSELTRQNENISVNLQQPFFIDDQWEIHVIITFWLSKKQRINFNQYAKLTQNIKDLLEGQISIKLKDPTQILIWGKVLNQVYLLKCLDSKIVINTIKRKFENNEDGLVINLQSRDADLDKIENMEANILNSLMHFTVFKFMVRIPDKDILGILSQSNIQNTFKRVFKKIHTKFDNQVLLEIIQDRNATQLECIAYHHKSYFSEEIEKALQINLLQQLEKVVEKIDLKKLLDFLNFENAFEMEECLELLIISSTGQVTFVGLKEQLNTLKTSIQAYHRMQHESITQQTLSFENDYMLRCVFKNLGQLQLLVPPQILNKQLLIKGDKKQIQEAVETINKIIENVKRQMISSTIQMPDLLSKYLQKYHQNDLTHIQNTFDCLIIEPNIFQVGKQNQLQMQIQKQQQNLCLPRAQQPVIGINQSNTNSMNYYNNSSQYQWSWLDGQTFVDYKSDENAYLDLKYAEFLQDQNKNTCLFNISPSTTPASHQIDLSTMIVTNLTEKSDTQLIRKPDGTYEIAGQVLSLEIQNYINQRITQGQTKFNIFLRKYRIKFVNTQKTQQINIETGYVRSIQKSLIQVNPQPANVHQPIRNYAQKNSQVGDTFQVQYQFQSQDKNSLDQALEEFGKLREQLTQTKLIRLPNINIDGDARFENLVSTIREKSIQIIGEIKPDSQITIFTIKEYLKQIESLIQVIPIVTYPSEWNSQDENLSRVELKQNEKEFNLIKGKFQQTYPSGQISAIFRIQNKHLYKNYVQEKNDLIRRNMNRNTPLTADEKEQLLWHGVRSSDPYLIYNSDKEGFDGTYANQGMWGIGVYFSTRADYSDQFSYQLTEKDDPKFCGHKVFLCCKVALGKAYHCDSDRNLKRPPPLPPPNSNSAYDSVSGITRQTKVYILYQMDIRRAYPAYEVIYR